MQVYQKVRAYIDAQGLKQIAVARKAGIPVSTFSAIMTGKRTMYADDLTSICRALNVSPEQFVDYQHHPA
jgi:transcriptional regulator with XRE-family HTH domain